MYSEIIPEGDEFCHPLFVSTLSFSYQMLLQGQRRGKEKIIYSTPHEIILNLHAFRNSDQVIYINRKNNLKVFSLTVERFKYMIAQSIYRSQEELELLYLRLFLTNRYSKAIIDKGRFRGYHQALMKLLFSIKAGYDCYLAYENRRTILYFKYRRLSSLQLLSVIQNWNSQHDIHLNHINVPKTLSNQSLLQDCLRSELTKEAFRMYSYLPVEGDNIYSITKIDNEIISVINQLIK